MIAPPQVVESRRNLVGWVLLAAIGIPLLLFVSVNFFSSAFTPASEARGCIAKLESAVRGDRMGAIHIGDWESVRSCVRTVAPARSKDELTAMLYAAYRHEKNLEVRPSDFVALSRSKYARHRAFASVYLEGSLTHRRADDLVRRMPNTSFVYTLAKVHALEKAGVPGARNRFLGKPGLDPAVVAGVVVLLGATMLGLGLWVVYAVLRAAGHLAPLGHPLGALNLPDADRCAMRSAQYLIAYVVASFAASGIEPLAKAVGLRPPTEPAVLVVHSILLAGAVVALTVARLDGRRLRLSDVGINGRGLWMHAGWGICGVVANVPIFLALGLISQWAFRGIPQVEHPVLTDAKQAAGFVAPALLFLGASVFAPFIEETWFRGTLLPAFSAIMKGPAWGIVVTSLIFASLHPTGLPSWLPLASIGAMGAMLTYQTKSLVPAIVMHALHNGITLAFTLLMT